MAAENFTNYNIHNLLEHYYVLHPSNNNPQEKSVPTVRNM